MSVVEKNITFDGIEYTAYLDYDAEKQSYTFLSCRRKKNIWDLNIDIDDELKLCKYELSDKFIDDVFSTLDW